MSAVWVAVGGYLLAVGAVAIWIGKAIALASRQPPQQFHVPDTAHEFLEMTR